LENARILWMGSASFEAADVADMEAAFTMKLNRKEKVTD